MKKIQETQLPGVGVRHEFETELHERIGIVTHHTGRREVVVYDHDDPDICRLAVQLTEDESHTLGEILGASQVSQSLANLQQMVGGLAIDWIPIGDNWACSGQTISDVALYETGVSIVAVIRDQETTPAPRPDFRLFIGDTVVVVGQPADIKQAFNAMHG